ncbi:MAG: hypothetical protein PHT60_15800 [Acidiphilium sp.]|nr:hypothetical protein [Acidiphilium sp.]
MNKHHLPHAAQRLDMFIIRIAALAGLFFCFGAGMLNISGLLGPAASPSVYSLLHSRWLLVFAVACLFIIGILGLPDTRNDRSGGTHKDG